MSNKIELIDRDFELAIINRDQVCKRCGGDKFLQAHRMYDSLEINYGRTPDNYVTLCKFCHEQYHEYYDENNVINLINFLGGIYE